MRTFASGALRNDADGKYDYEGFLHPAVVRAFGEYMHKHRRMEDGTLRDSDNWQAGIPPEELLKSKTRHDIDLWLHMRGWGHQAVEPKRDALCAILFNTMALLYADLQQEAS